ncbi:MAG TPA: flagellar basal body P-ring formation chaperone FlgA [Paucimonas sp.]|nr:flagellar basal body P-ring formation chaperone FlgA [Paucimonas sp.]
MRSSLFFLLSFLPGLLLPAAAAADATVRIALRDDVLVAKADITVGDVAQVAAADSGIKTSIERLRVGRAPRVGHVLQIGREELMYLVRTRTALAGNAVMWSGAVAVKVRSASQSFDGSAIVDAGRRFLHEALAPRFAKVDVQFDERLPDVVLPPGAVTLHARASDLTHVHARMPVWVDIAVDGHVYRAIVLPFKVSAQRLVFVARTALAEGSAVGPNDFDLVEQDVAAIAAVADTPVTSDEFAPSRLRRALRSGDILRRSQLMRAGVLRGDIVKLVVATRDVRIETRATAQQDGELGQRVSVKPEHGDTAVAARIVAAGVAAVEEK